MLRGHFEAAWSHTAALLALTAEINRDREQRSEPFTPKDFHPLHAQDDSAATPEQLEARMREQRLEWEARKRRQ